MLIGTYKIYYFNMFHNCMIKTNSLKIYKDFLKLYFNSLDFHILPTAQQLHNYKTL